jgi:hypothetical protein
VANGHEQRGRNHQTVFHACSPIFGLKVASQAGLQCGLALP